MATLRWRTVGTTTVFILIFVITSNFMTDLPSSELDAELGAAAASGINNRHRQNLRLFQEGDDAAAAAVADRKPERRPKGNDNAMNLFDDDDDAAAGGAAHGDGDGRRPPDVERSDEDKRRPPAAAAADDSEAAAERKREEERLRREEEMRDAAAAATAAAEKVDRADRVGADGGKKRRGPDSLLMVGEQHDLVKKDLPSAAGGSKELDPSKNNNSVLLENVHELGAIVRKLKSGIKGSSHKILKPHPFKYVLNAPKLCGNDDVFVLAYVHTAPDHYMRRTVIRHTWGDTSRYDVTMRVVFVMGVVGGSGREADSTQRALVFEAEQYGDIVQEDFIDTYHNLTHKGVAALRWIDVHCSRARFVLKTDDDIFVNTFTLFRILKKIDRQETRPLGFIMCLVWYGMPVQRTGKWKVTREEWPDDSYPTYCSGSAFVLSTDAAVSMHRVSYEVPFFWVDDFYITGLLPLMLGNLTHRQFSSAYVLNGDHLEEMFTGPQWYVYVFSHVHNLNRIQTVWDTLVQLAAGKIRPKINSRVAVGNR